MTLATNYHCRICTTDGFPTPVAVFKHQREAHPEHPKVKAANRRMHANGKNRGKNGKNGKNGKKVALVKANGKGALTHPSTEEHGDVIADEYLSFPLGYAVGRTEAQLEAYARGIGLPAASFTSRVARLLQRAARGQVLGS